MSRVIAIIKTAKDDPPWKGLPDDYPVSCCEFDSFEEAERAHPGKLIMRIEDYKDYSARWHDENPSPKRKLQMRTQRYATVKQQGLFAQVWYWIKFIFTGGY